MNKAQWKSSPSNSALRRLDWLRPGYNCGERGDRCQHPEKGDHGKAADERNFAVSNGVAALVVNVMTVKYPEDAQSDYTREQMRRHPAGWWTAALGLHLPFPSREDSVNEDRPCDLIERGRCYHVPLSILWSERWFRDNWTGHIDNEPQEFFWLVLEQTFLDQIEDYMPEVKA